MGSQDESCSTNFDEFQIVPLEELAYSLTFLAAFSPTFLLCDKAYPVMIKHFKSMDELKSFGAEHESYLVVYMCYRHNDGQYILRYATVK